MWIKMRTLKKIVYIDTPGSFIGFENDRIYVKKRDEDKKMFIHLFDLDALVINNTVSISSQALIKCATDQVNVLFSDWKGEYQASIEGCNSKNVFIRKSQLIVNNDKILSMNVARRMVLEKIDSMFDIFAFSEYLDLRDKIKVESEYEALLGYEGVASKIYFSYLRDEFKSVSIPFGPRSFYPPTDEGNALLSLSYSMLFNEVQLLSRTFGFDPAFGFLHRDYYGRDSLVCDLMEPFRSRIADSYCLYAINEIDIRQNDFKLESGRCLFHNQEKRTAFYKLFRTKFFTDDLRGSILDFIREIYNLIIELSAGKELKITDKVIGIK
jgi:CRISPR-associated protein Cas1